MRGLLAGLGFSVVLCVGAACFIALALFSLAVLGPMLLALVAGVAALEAIRAARLRRRAARKVARPRAGR